MKKFTTLSFVFMSACLAVSSVSFAGKEATPTPTLKSVMQELATSMNQLSLGIFNEDYALIAKSAGNIADHPKPKSQLPTVVKTLNVRMPKFKSYDGKVHNAAADIVKLAKKKDMSQILIKQKIIIENCVGCHTDFREEVAAALSN